MLKNWNRKILDDLEIGESRIVVDADSVLTKGTYQGLHRSCDGRWAVVVQTKKGGADTVIFTEYIDKIRRLRK